MVGEMVAAGYWVRDEKSMRLEVVGIFIVGRGDGVGELEKSDVLENITLAEEEPLLEDIGRTVDGERLTLDEIDDLAVRRVVGEKVADDGVVVGTSDGERLVLERVATVVVFVGEADDAVDVSGIAGETALLETTGGSEGELVKLRVQYRTTHSLA